MIRELIGELEQGWKDALADFIGSRKGRTFLREIDALLDIPEINYHPTGRAILNAFHATPFKDVRVVIIGQDPYWKPDEATGLAFFADGEYTQSLKNINAAIRCDNCGER